MSKPLNELDRQLRLIKRLRDMHMEAFWAFTAYEAVQELRSPLHVGKSEARMNAEAIGTVRYFFNVAVNSLNFNFLMLVSILFIEDKTKTSLSIPKILNVIEQNPVTIEQFKELNKGRPLLESVSEGYEGVKSRDLAQLRAKLKKVEKTVTALRSNRNKIWAHRDINALVPDKITYEDISTLLTIGDEILEQLTSTLNRESTSYFLIKSETVDHTKQLVKMLREQEASSSVGLDK